MTTTTEQWLHDLQSFIDDTLAPILPDRTQYLTPAAMKIWAAAFTHETVSMNDNYEDLEYLGDRILKGAFAQYLIRKFPQFHKREFTELDVKIMSKMTQSRLSERLGFGAPGRVRVLGLNRTIVNLTADVFESFFGALCTVSDNIVMGLGYANCYNMLVYLLQNEQIDPMEAVKAIKTDVIQIFSRFAMPNPEERWDQESQRFQVVLNRDHLAFLRQNGVTITSPVIGFGKGSTKTEAENEAYRKAYTLLESQGVSREWAERIKHQQDFSDPAVVPYVPAAVEKLRREGFFTMKFFIPRKTVTKQGSIVQLIGIREDGSTEVLQYEHTTDRTNSYRQAKSTLLRNYIAA